MKERIFNVDLIRCIAVYSVCSVHFFLNSGFYNVPMTGGYAYFMTIIRTMSMMCVPLFLLLTGYLMCKKELSLRYYKGIIRILLTHGICTLLIYAYQYFFQHAKLDWEIVLKGFFSNQAYSWYIGLYMALFCLIPFLNLIYNSLDARWKKRTLILTMVALTALPSAANYFFRIVPDSFTAMYPITYYFIGAYIREYSEEWKKRWFLVLFCVLTIVNASLNFAISAGGQFAWKALADWGGLENTLTAPMLFIIVSKLKTDKVPEFVKKCVSKIAQVSLGIYLLSWIFDQYAYPKLKTAVAVIEDRWKFYIVMVLFVFIFAFALSIIADWICRGIIKAFSKLFDKRSSKTVQIEK